jgi:tetratricopeptide (TPR) repeat protein
MKLSIWAGPRLYRSWSIFVLACSFTGIVSAQQVDFEDFESRIDYAYFTEDLNALANLIQTLRGAVEKGEGGAAASHYLLGLAHYRRGSLLSGKNKPELADAFAACVEDLGKAIDAHPKFADAYALQSACYGNLAVLRSWKRMIDTPLSALRMENALRLAPANPRAILLDGLRDYQGHKILGGDKSRALEKFRRAIELFESQRQISPDAPGWGLADAYAWLGRCLMENGDTLGARNAFERALIVAPDFAAVRRDLRQLLR